MPRKQVDVERALLAKGFQSKDGDHHYFIYHSRAGRKTRVFTKTSHGSREIDDNLLSMMAKHCRLSNKEFGQLVECPLTRESYEGKLIAAGLVERPPEDRATDETAAR